MIKSRITAYSGIVMDASISDLSKRIRVFIEERDWDQFHDPKDLAISLCLEASEVLEHFQWKNKDEVNTKEIGEELADVLYWVILLSNKFDINLSEAFENKMIKNEKKYPVDKSKGNKAKYTQLKQDSTQE